VEESDEVRQIIAVWAALAVAALLETGGDAGVRLGLRGHVWGFVVGPLSLVAYGFVVNLSRWDFSRLMGVYIAIFFLVSQLLAVILFRERPQLPLLVGGALIVAGGMLLTFWQAPAKQP
jgi:drug/metabolite transporter (DMT)-like permease